MKGKSLIVTSVLMVVLLVAALSTATFAWFSASNVVNLASISFTASSRNEGVQEATGGLRISWVENAGEEDLLDEIDIASGSHMIPMIPLAAPEIGVTTYADFIGSFRTATQITTDDGVRYAGNPIAATPYTCGKPVLPGEPSANVFYLYNTGDYTMRVSVGYDIGGVNADALRVAVFTNGIYRGVMRKGDLHYGTIVKGALVTGQAKVAYDAEAAEKVQFSIAGAGSVDVRLVAWYDGVLLGDEGAELDAILTDFGFVGSYTSA